VISHPETVRRGLLAKKKLRTAKDANRWLWFVTHAVHLGLLRRGKAADLFRLVQTVTKDKFGNPLPVWQERYGKNIPDVIMEVTYKGPARFTENTKRAIENPMYHGWHTKGDKHVMCKECRRCACGCGMDESAFRKARQEQEYEREQEPIRELAIKLGEVHGLTDAQVKTAYEHMSVCRSGRWKTAPCNCGLAVQLGLKQKPKTRWQERIDDIERTAPTHEEKLAAVEKLCWTGGLTDAN
jgi:hypothetical protein